MKIFEMKERSNAVDASVYTHVTCNFEYGHYMIGTYYNYSENGFISHNGDDAYGNYRFIDQSDIGRIVYKYSSDIYRTKCLQINKGSIYPIGILMGSATRIEQLNPPIKWYIGDVTSKMLVRSPIYMKKDNDRVKILSERLGIEITDKLVISKNITVVDNKYKVITINDKYNYVLTGISLEQTYHNIYII